LTKDARVYLAHILERAARIARFIEDGEDAFFIDEKTQDAVIRNFEVIGEAVKRIPDEYRDAHADVPWKLMAGFRDVLIHGYEGLDLGRVWDAASRDLPTVRAAIEAMLPPLDRLEEELAEGADERKRGNGAKGA
jgi:uncharacterized protein with HEPN domain